MGWLCGRTKEREEDERGGSRGMDIEKGTDQLFMTLVVPDEADQNWTTRQSVV